MNVKFAIFDIGQVCYPYTLEYLNCYLRECSNNQALFDGQNGVYTFDYNPFMRGEYSFAQFCKEICAYCDVNYTKDKESLIDEAMHQGIGKFYDGTLEVMQNLRKRGIELALLSNALPNLRDVEISLVQKKYMFFSFNLGMLKPDVAIYKVVLDKLGVGAEEVIFIDDKERNTNAAESVGIKSIVFNEKNVVADVMRIVEA